MNAWRLNLAVGLACLVLGASLPLATTAPATAPTIEQLPPPVHEVTATAYSARAFPGPTALGTAPMPGRTIAVSRDLLHLLGRRVYVAGLGVRRVEDLMHERIRNTIDVYLPTDRDARAFGRQTVRLVALPENTEL